MIGAAGLFAISSFWFQSCWEYEFGLLGIETMGNWKLLWDIYVAERANPRNHLEMLLWYPIVGIFFLKKKNWIKISKMKKSL
jgi:hypothetical protein